MYNSSLNRSIGTSNKSIKLERFPIFTEEYYLEGSSSELVQKFDDSIQNIKHDHDFVWKGQSLPTINDETPLRMIIYTWNMMGELLSDSLPMLIQKSQLMHHIIAFGSQECTRSIGLSFFCDSKTDWENDIQQYLGSDYILIESNKLNALHLCLFCHQSVFPLISEVQSDTFATGFMEVLGNKGGIAISIKINRKRIVFVNSHLKSGQDYQDHRNQEFQKILLNLQLSNQKSSRPLNERFDYTIWMGDFNSRINENLNRQSMEKIGYFQALQRDQLLQSRFEKNWQREFKEGEIRFPPTYKLELNVNRWSTNWRIPGWTDRILFHENKNNYQLKTKNKNQIIQDPTILLEHQEIEDGLILYNYDCAFNVGGSDHRPVYAQFTVKI